MVTSLAETKMARQQPQLWAYKVAKASIYPASLAAINGRIAALQPLLSQQPLTIPPVTHASCSPLYLSVDVNEALACAQLGTSDTYASPTGPSPFPDEVATAVIRSVARTFARLHAHGVVHGHVHLGVVRQHVRHPSRVVLLEAELPMSAMVPQGLLGEEARRCAAPEILRGAPYGAASDVWGLGVLLLQLLCVQARLCSTADLVDSDLLSPFLAALSPQAKSFVLPCLKNDPQARPLLLSILQHPYLHPFPTDSAAAGEATTGDNWHSSDEKTDSEEASDEDSVSADSH
jgi:hypothetical protein